MPIVSAPTSAVELAGVCIHPFTQIDVSNPTAPADFRYCAPAATVAATGLEAVSVPSGANPLQLRCASALPEFTIAILVSNPFEMSNSGASICDAENGPSTASE